MAAVVQYTPQNIAAQAGQFNVNAANAASSMVQDSISQAIQTINQQYNSAAMTLAPATMEGTQALDALNSYLGLNPYNPGAAPTAPTAPSLSSIASTISRGDINNYIQQNSIIGPGQTLEYGGYGAAAGASPGPNGNETAGPGIIREGMDVGGVYKIAQDQGVGDAVRQGLAQEVLNNPNSPQNSAYQSALTNYNQQQKIWQQQQDLYKQYSAAGPLTPQQVTDRITNLPGYQAQLSQGIQAIDASAGSKGYLGSGNILTALNSFGQNTLASFYGNQLNHLASLAGMGTQAAESLANNTQNQGNVIAGLQTSLGTSNANAALSAGNSLAQSLIAGNQQFQTIGQQNQNNLGGIGSLAGGLASLIGSGGTNPTGLMNFL